MDWSLFQTQMIADSQLMLRISKDTWEEMKARVGSCLTQLLLRQVQAGDL
jgi:hypothetical protein